VRYKIDRRFEDRVLAALEKPKSNKYLAILNSAFFLWILTAICIAVGGSFFSQRQRCILESDSLSWRYYDLDDEIRGRDEYMRRVVRDAQTFEDVEKGQAAYLTANSEFRGKSASELSTMRHRIISFSDLPDDPTYSSELPISQMEFNIRVMMDTPEKRSLQQLKDDEKYLTETRKSRDNKIPILVANCSFKNILYQLISGQSRFLTRAYLVTETP